MTFRELLDTVRLRWYVALVVAALTLAAGWKVDHPPRYYQATSVLLLIPPKEPTAPNALAAATPSIAKTGLLVDTILSDATSAERLREAGVTGKFSVAPRNNGTVQTPHYSIPAEQLIVDSGDPDEALSSLAVLADQYDRALDDLQARAGVQAAVRITTQVLVSPAVAPVNGSKSRGLLGVALLGSIAMFLLPVAFDRYARRKNARKGTLRKPPGAPGAESGKERFAG